MKSNDPVAALFSSLAAEDARLRALREQAKQARRNDPVARARRSAAVRKGWETRRASAAAEQVADAADYDDALPPRPWCEEMAHNSVGSEVFCVLPPGHPREEDHEDGSGYSWPHYD